MVLILIILGGSLRILNEYERSICYLSMCIERRRDREQSSSFPSSDKLVKVSLRTVTMDVPAQDVITPDNISIKVNAVMYFRVMDPNKAILEIENYLYGTWLPQTTLRSVCGQVELDDILTGQDQFPAQNLDKRARPWA